MRTCERGKLKPKGWRIIFSPIHANPHKLVNSSFPRFTGTIGGSSWLSSYSRVTLEMLSVWFGPPSSPNSSANWKKRPKDTGDVSVRTCYLPPHLRFLRPLGIGAVRVRQAVSCMSVSLRGDFYPAVTSHLRHAGKLIMEVPVTFNDSGACKMYSPGRLDA